MDDSMSSKPPLMEYLYRMLRAMSQQGLGGCRSAATSVFGREVEDAIDNCPISCICWEDSARPLG